MANTCCCLDFIGYPHDSLDFVGLQLANITDFDTGTGVTEQGSLFFELVTVVFGKRPGPKSEKLDYGLYWLALAYSKYFEVGGNPIGEATA
jgi:hypothetical protein